MGNSIQYDGTLNCALSVSDLGKALSWYEDMLGFDVLMRSDEMGWAELSTSINGVTLGLSQVETVEPAGGATLVFGVANVDASRKKLEDKDVRFDGETQTIPEMVKIATFFDPDGNKFMLAETLSAQ